MTTVHAGLLAAVIASPDDFPRLVLADWYGEHGEMQAHEQFVRLLMGCCWICTVNDSQGVPDREYQFARPVLHGCYVGKSLAVVRRYGRRSLQWMWDAGLYPKTVNRSTKAKWHGKEPSRAASCEAAERFLFACHGSECFCHRLDLSELEDELKREPERAGR